MKLRAMSTTLRERSRLVVLLNHSHLPTRWGVLVDEFVEWDVKRAYFADVEAIDTAGEGV